MAARLRLLRVRASELPPRECSVEDRTFLPREKKRKSEAYHLYFILRFERRREFYFLLPPFSCIFKKKKNTFN